MSQNKHLVQSNDINTDAPISQCYGCNLLIVLAELCYQSFQDKNKQQQQHQQRNGTLQQICCSTGIHSYTGCLVQ
jgi:hypothetical protein